MISSEANGWEATQRDIYRRHREYLKADLPSAITVVTDVEGSAYRRPGAKLVVSDKDQMGAITAGCLEDPVAERANEAIENGMSFTETYDLTDNDDDTWGMGLGCNGVIDVLIDPLDESLHPALDAVANKERAVVCTIVAAEAPCPAVGARTVIRKHGERVTPPDDINRPSIPNLVVDELDDQCDMTELERSTTETVETEEGTVTVFLDLFEPVPDLLVFGHQGDVRPVTRLGREVGFRVRVVTSRGARADTDRFPAADEVESTRAPDVSEIIDAPEHTYAVLMSHNFLDDRMALDSLLATQIPYIGLMGPRNRFEKMRAEFANEGRELGIDELDRISTPVGLNLGGNEPTQIAMSVVSEVVAVYNDRNGGRLSEREGPIHS